MPFVFLLASTIARASESPGRAVKMMRCLFNTVIGGEKKNIFRLLHANLLVNGLLEMLIVHNGSHFSITVGGPIGSGNFHTRFTGINSKAEKEKCIQFFGGKRIEL